MDQECKATLLYFNSPPLQSRCFIPALLLKKVWKWHGKGLNPTTVFLSSFHRFLSCFSTRFFAASLLIVTALSLSFLIARSNCLDRQATQAIKPSVFCRLVQSIVTYLYVHLGGERQCVQWSVLSNNTTCWLWSGLEPPHGHPKKYIENGE